MQIKNDFIIKTETFEGPLDLILHLVEKRKLLINDISLAKVTDDYIAYTKSLDQEKQMSLSKTSSFILIASTLLLIKSKSLLPTLELFEDEEQSIQDLELRLKIYKQIKEAGVTIQERFGKNILFPRQEKPNTTIVFAPTAQIAVPSLLESIKSILNSLPKIERLPQAVIQKVVSLDDMIHRLTDRITRTMQMSFKEFSGGKQKITQEIKATVIVSFLAMLELVKQGTVRAKQEAKYDDIMMESNEISTPSYT